MIINLISITKDFNEYSIQIDQAIFDEPVIVKYWKKFKSYSLDGRNYYLLIGPEIQEAFKRGCSRCRMGKPVNILEPVKDEHIH